MNCKVILIWLVSSTSFAYTSEDAVGFPAVERMEITTNIKTRFAVTTMRATVYNFEDTSVEVKNTFFLPLTCFISNFTALVGETLFVGKVETREEAQDMYDKATADDQSAGIVHQSMEQAPDGFAPFSITLNVGPNERIVFIIEYQEVLMRYMSKYEILIPTISTELIHHFSVRAIIEDENEITRFDFSESPIERVREDNNNQEFLYSTTDPSSMKASIEFDVANADDSGILYVDPDMQYFVHFFSPPGLQVLSKQIVFVIDCSGSMSGDKIEQAKDAIRNVLDILLPGDHFDVICFDTSIVRWGSRLNEASAENRNSAKVWINENVRPKDMTNIEAGLTSAISVLKSGGTLSMPVVVFLTDGKPTTGETDPLKIRQRVKSENSQGLCIHSLGFGEGADMMFLNALSLENCGIAWKVFANTEAGDNIENFFDTASQPLVRNVGVQYKVGSTPLGSDFYGTNYDHYFAGMEVITTGRFPSRFDSDVEIDVEGVSALGDYTQSKLIPRASINEKPYIPRMWAHLWIQHLSRQIAIADLDPSLDQSSLEAEATAIALEYNLVTPYTSIVVVADDQSPEDDENTKSPTMATGMRGMTNEADLYASNIQRSTRSSATRSSLLFALFLLFLRL